MAGGSSSGGHRLREWLASDIGRRAATLARESTLRRVFESSYGSCDKAALMQSTSRVLDLDQMQDDLADIKLRTDWMPHGGVPWRCRRHSVAGSDCRDRWLKRARPPPNALLEEYWDVYKALVR
jgi:hypothetical protein